MPPSLKLNGTPILIDLDALRPRKTADVINLTKDKARGVDAILVDNIDPLTLLIAGTRRKTRR